MTAPAITYSSANDSSQVFGVPAGLANGDFRCILFQSWQAVSTPATTPAGYTLVDSIIKNYDSPSTDHFHQYLWVKVVTNAGAEGSVTISTTGTVFNACGMSFGVRGSSAYSVLSDGIDDHGTNFDVTNTSTAATTGAAVDASTSEDTLIIGLICDVIGLSIPSTAQRWAVDGGDTYGFDQTLSGTLSGATYTTSGSATINWTVLFVTFMNPGGGGGGSQPFEVQDYGPPRSRPQRRPESYFFGGGAAMMTPPAGPLTEILDRPSRPLGRVASESWLGSPENLLTSPSIPGNFMPVFDPGPEPPRQRPSDPQNNLTNFIFVPTAPAGAQMNNPLARPFIAVKSEEWWGTPENLLTAVAIIPAGMQVFDRNAQPPRFRPVDAPQPTQGTLLLQGWANQAASLWPSRAIIVPKFRPEGVFLSGNAVISTTPPLPAGALWVLDRPASPPRQRPVMDTPNDLPSLLSFVAPTPAGVQWILDRLAKPLPSRPSDGIQGNTPGFMQLPVPQGLVVYERLAKPLRARPTDGPLGMPENLLTAPAVLPAGKQFWQRSADRLRQGQLNIVAFYYDDGITSIVLDQNSTGGNPRLIRLRIRQINNTPRTFPRDNIRRLP